MTYTHPDRQALIAAIVAAADPGPAHAPAPAAAPVAVFPAATAPASPYAPALPVASAPTDASALWDKVVARVNARIRSASPGGF